MLELYKNCKLCPRNCGVNRLNGEIGFCGETAELRIGFAGIHKGEEPPLVGTGGSGTVFVRGCNLRCTFCQNWQISQGSQGDKHMSVTRADTGTDTGTDTRADTGTDMVSNLCQSPYLFTQICAALKEKGAENINIVTGSHAVPALVESLTAAKAEGLDLPVVWNSSGYENTETLELLKGKVDIFLPDLKTLDCDIAKKYFNAPDYPQAAAAAVLKMMEMSHNAQEKTIIRHLILPGCLDSTRAVLRWFADNAAGKAQLSLMSQYTPIPNRKGPMPNRFLNEDEYNTVCNWLNEFGIEDGFCQEFVTGSDWLPDFKRPNPFSSELSVPVYQPPDFLGVKNNITSQK